MTSLFRSTARVIKQAVSLLALLLLLTLVGSSIAAYLTVTGRSPALLRLVTARVAQLLAGQHTEQLSLDVLLQPAGGRLVGKATMVVQSTDEARQRFYFLLNDGLHVRRGTAARARSASARTDQHAVSIYQLWLLTVVDLGTPVPKGASVALTLEYDGVPASSLFEPATVADAQHIVVPADGFWYPADLQSFFEADVTATVPRLMTVVHNGVRSEQFERGALRTFHWTTERPVSGLALVAGQFELTTTAADGITYRLYLPPDTPLDATRLLGLLSQAHAALRSRYGDSGFNHVTLFVDRTLGHSFNDGAGLIGLPMRQLRTGDYGFASIAYNIARNWWGGTVAGRALSPASGSAWLDEGMAAFSSLVATETTYGPEALWRRRRETLFDPARPAVLAQQSVLANALGGPRARATSLHKGAYVALMLRRQLGDEHFFAGARQFLERFKFQHASERDLQEILQETSEQNLERFFTDWVRGTAHVDLSLDGTSAGEITVGNLGSALVAGDLDLWTFKRTGGEPVRTTVHVGDRLPLDADTDHAVVDPSLLWADGHRGNNRYPRALAPVYVAMSSHGDLAVTSGERFPWARSAVAYRGSDARIVHTWDFARGILAAPAWSPDNTHLVVSYSESPDAWPAIVTLAANGAQRTIGYGTAPAVATDGTIYAGQPERIVRFGADGTESTVVQHRGEVLDQPLPAPDGSRLAYTAAREHGADLRLVNRDGSDDRLLLTWDRDRMQYCWSADGTRLYAVAGGTWDWQVWEIPADGGSVATLASGAAAIGALALSPDGSQLAFTAAPELDYPGNRRRLYVLRLRDRTVRNIDVPGFDLGALTWMGAESIVVVATPAATDARWLLPPQRVLKRVQLTDGSVTDMS